MHLKYIYYLFLIHGCTGMKHFFFYDVFVFFFKFFVLHSEYNVVTLTRQCCFSFFIFILLFLPLPLPLPPRQAAAILKSIKDNTKEREVFQWTRDHKVQQWNGRHSLEQWHQRMMPGHHASHEHSKRRW